MYSETVVCVTSMNISMNRWMQNVENWKSVFFGDFYLLSPFPHPSPAFPLPKQPQNCQLYHNFYLLHWRVTPPPSICLVLVQYGLLVEERIYLNISRVIICNIPTRQFLSSGQVSAMLVSLRVKHRRWDAHTSCGQKHLCEYNENILVDLNCQLIVDLSSYSTTLKESELYMKVAQSKWNYPLSHVTDVNGKNHTISTDVEKTARNMCIFSGFAPNAISL